VSGVTQAARSGRSIAWIPNALSIARIALAVAFPLVVPQWRLAIVIASAASDLLDGLIARTLKVMSVKGGLLDATADKLFVVSVLGTFVYDDVLTWVTALLVMTRDFAVAGVALYAALRRKWSAFQRMPVSWLGKATTVAQFALFICLLTPWWRLDLWIVGITVGLSVVAGCVYLARLFDALRESR
jgi:phosphatidylglycerophosphate synthase